MSKADDIGNLFLRFGASADAYKEINSEFEYLEPAQPSAQATPPAPVKAPAVQVVELKRTPTTTVVTAPQPEKAASTGVVTRSAPPQAQPRSLRERLEELALERRTRGDEQNRDVVSKWQGAEPARRPEAHVIAVVSAKGGVGKTTVAAALSKLLKRRVGRVVALDLDAQNALLSHFHLPRTTPGFNQAYLHGHGWGDAFTPTEAGVQCIPFGPSNAADQRTFDALLAEQPDWLARQLADLELGRDDVLVIDTPTGSSPWLNPVLSMADQVLAVTQADAASYLVLDKLQAWLSLLPPQACAFLVNKVDQQHPLSMDMSALLRQQLGSQWLAEIPLDLQLDQALAFEYEPFNQSTDSPACQMLRVIANHLALGIEHCRKESAAQ
jgi:cellulose synthase operon protein YhjQ